MTQPTKRNTWLALGLGIIGLAVLIVAIGLGSQPSGFSFGLARPTQAGAAEPTPLSQTPQTPAPVTLVFPTAIPMTEIEVKVSSTTPKNPTRISVIAGETLYFEYARGQWTADPVKQPLNTGCGLYYDDPDPSHIYPFDTRQNTGSTLIGYLGGPPFMIGCRRMKYVAPNSGELFLGINDCENCFPDNQGEIFVRIARAKE